MNSPHSPAQMNSNTFCPTIQLDHILLLILLLISPYRNLVLELEFIQTMCDDVRIKHRWRVVNDLYENSLLLSFIVSCKSAMLFLFTIDFTT